MSRTEASFSTCNCAALSGVQLRGQNRRSSRDRRPSRMPESETANNSGLEYTPPLSPWCTSGQYWPSSDGPVYRASSRWVSCFTAFVTRGRPMQGLWVRPCALIKEIRGPPPTPDGEPSGRASRALPLFRSSDLTQPVTATTRAEESCPVLHVPRSEREPEVLAACDCGAVSLHIIRPNSNLMMRCLPCEGGDDEACANCGKLGSDAVKLKNCTACRLVKYCGVDCQRAHRKKHKKACKQRVAELKDEQLYSQGHERPEGDFCPICILPIPKEGSDCDQLTWEKYCHGRLGLQKDIRKAVELYTEAAELGSVRALFNLGNAYRQGNGEQDMAKAAEFYKKAAMQGHVESRACNQEQYAEALKGYQDAVEEMKSPQRDEAMRLGHLGKK
ncbi:hypothetical protein THAOC_00306 [Thalassiosira oceanica]|uniref:MYND-type domain-containing protein n=1 Tax=Thalassiosira oceanica TaxID=159749 RepID=K0TGG6_THAOC|nr:hypothetical protein THAOC_00306 [Thalassiosira oceanica]|eukprot:EJK77833.1 hypothetical protein THAOC_00306 [Thalassiosira oceanica]